MAMLLVTTSKTATGSNVIYHDDVAIITGEKTLDANSSSSGLEYAQTTWNISYPTGFSKNNCIVLAFQGSLDTNLRVGAYGTGPVTSTNAVRATLPRTVVLWDDLINLECWNPAYSEKTYYYKLVLLKIS